MPSVASRYADITPKRSAVQGIPMPKDELSDLKAPVVLMVSGGADSTALLVLAANSTLDIADGRGKAHIARERLHVLHVNHQLRGIDAQEDEGTSSQAASSPAALIRRVLTKSRPYSTRASMPSIT